MDQLWSEHNQVILITVHEPTKITAQHKFTEELWQVLGDAEFRASYRTCQVPSKTAPVRGAGRAGSVLKAKGTHYADLYCVALSTERHKMCISKYMYTFIGVVKNYSTRLFVDILEEHTLTTFLSSERS